MKVGPTGFLALTALALLASAKDGPNIKCVVKVPREYRKTQFNLPPNGEPEPVRYTVAYEAF